MTTRSSIPRNTLYHSASAATSLLLFVLVIIAARSLGPEDFGIFSFALAFVFLFDFVLDPGLYHLLIREIARQPHATRQYVLHGMAWKMIAAPVAFFLIWAVVNLLHDAERIHTVVYLIALASFLKSAKDVYRATLLAHERFGLEALSTSVERGGLLAFGALVLLFDKGLIALCVVFVIVRALDLAVAHLLVRRIVGHHSVEFRWDFLRGLLRSGFAIGAFYVMLNVYSYIDMVMISALRNAEEVGWYSAAYKLYEGLLTIPVVVSMVLFPRLANLYVHDYARFSTLALQGWKYVLLLGFAALVVGVPLVAPGIELLYGEGYDPSAIALTVLLASAPFLFIANFLQTLMITMDRQAILLKVAVAGLSLNVIFNLLAIPRYGYVGAAVVTVVVEALVSVTLYFWSLERFRAPPAVRMLMKLAACTAVAAFIGWGVAADAAHLVRAGIAGITFLLSLRLSGLITGHDLRDLISSLRNGRVLSQDEPS